MTKLRKMTLAEQVCRELSLRILSGALPAGTRLTGEGLGAEFGISRTPVRDALKQLAAEGLVQELPRGYRVAELDPEALQELLACRSRFECLALELAWGRLPDERLAALLAELERPADDAERRRVSLEVDHELHELILACCPNRYLVAATRQLIRQCAPYRNCRTLDPARSPDALIGERTRLLKALRQQDFSAAAALLAAHIAGGAVIPPESDRRTRPDSCR